MKYLLHLTMFLLSFSLTVSSYAATKKDTDSSNLNAVVAPNDGSGYTYKYGVIPVTANLCSSVSLGGGIAAGGGITASIQGQAGGGWLEAVWADAQADITIPATVSAGMSSGGSISTSNCVPLINTKAPVDFSSFNPEERYFKSALTTKTTGGEVDTNEMALSIMKQAIGLNVSLATSRVVLANFGVINKSISAMITEGDPLNFQNVIKSMTRIADNSSDLMHPRIKRTFLHLDQAFVRHLTNLDVIGKSCTDLNSGNITHMPQILISRLDNVCSDWKEVQNIMATFIDDVNNSLGKVGDTGKQMAALIKNGKTITALASSLNTGVEEVKLTAEAIGGSVSQLSDTVGQSKKVIDKSVNGAKSVITTSLNALNGTVQKVNSAASNAGSFASTGLQDLKGEVDTTVTLINDLSFGRITAMPGKIATKVADTITSTISSTTSNLAGQLCGLGIKVATVEVTVKSIPGVSGILGC